ncbi:DUF4357 domain-containing protein [Reichenbachiella sp.]|uniref:DUF4357 domain-containing protein n=1 Tax=Reichenbachiella sp. TaxID=2184521 RepID=UPI003B5BBBBE
MIKLKSFEIKSTFKNLDSLHLDFEKSNGITLLIGNNGSGKSNLIEALSSAFAGLFDRDFDPTFSYELSYEKGDAPITISYDHTKTSRSRYQYNLSDTTDYLPNQIISVYSGEEARLWNRYYFKFYDDFMKNVISSKTNFSERQKMVFINKYYWNTALLTMIVSDLDLSDILDDRKIDRIELEFKKHNTDNITNYNSRKPNDVTRFAASILTLATQNTENPERYSISLDNFRSSIPYTHTDLFKLLSICLLPKEDNWKLINKIELFFEDGYSTEELSEGEKKQILIKFITRIFADDNSLLLMDEPDSHIHISNKEKIKNLLYDLEDKVHVQSILTTHSPTLTHCFENDNVYMLVNKDGKVTIEDKTKQEIVNDLTNEFWNLQEQNIFNSSQKPVSLFVEGKHDKIHIQNAFNTLKSDYPELSFDIFNMNSACNIPPMMLGLRTSEVDYGKLFIGIFDDDDTGRTELSNTKSQFPNSQNKKRHELGFYAFKYPKHSDHKSKAFTVENMFDSNHFEEAFKESLAEYQFKGKSLDSITDETKDKAKNILAEKSKDFTEEDFKHFRALFDQIKAIKVDFETNYSPEPEAETPAESIVRELFLFNNASGYFNPETHELTLLRGSRINREYTPSTKEPYKQTRNTLIETLSHNIDGNEIEILQDHQFDTPSGAAKFVNAGNRNGWTSWKNEHGESLKDKYGDA